MELDSIGLDFLSSPDASTMAQLQFTRRSGGGLTEMKKIDSIGLLVYHYRRVASRRSVLNCRHRHIFSKISFFFVKEKEKISGSVLGQDAQTPVVCLCF